MCVLAEPTPFRVVQRSGFRFNAGHYNAPAIDGRGSGRIALRGHTDLDAPESLRVRISGLGEARGIERHHAAVPFAMQEREFRATLEVPAGGWYTVSAELQSGVRKETCSGGQSDIFWSVAEPEHPQRRLEMGFDSMTHGRRPV